MASNTALDEILPAIDHSENFRVTSDDNKYLGKAIAVIKKIGRKIRLQGREEFDLFGPEGKMIMHCKVTKNLQIFITLPDESGQKSINLTSLPTFLPEYHQIITAMTLSNNPFTAR